MFARILLTFAVVFPDRSFSFFIPSVQPGLQIGISKGYRLQQLQQLERLRQLQKLNKKHQQLSDFRPSYALDDWIAVTPLRVGYGPPPPPSGDFNNEIYHDYLPPLSDGYGVPSYKPSSADTPLLTDSYGAPVIDTYGSPLDPPVIYDEVSIDSYEAPHDLTAFPEVSIDSYGAPHDPSPYHEVSIDEYEPPEHPEIVPCAIDDHSYAAPNSVPIPYKHEEASTDYVDLSLFSIFLRKLEFIRSLFQRKLAFITGIFRIREEPDIYVAYKSPVNHHHVSPCLPDLGGNSVPSGGHPVPSGGHSLPSGGQSTASGGHLDKDYPDGHLNGFIVFPQDSDLPGSDDFGTQGFFPPDEEGIAGSDTLDDKDEQDYREFGFPRGNIVPGSEASKDQDKDLGIFYEDTTKENLPASAQDQDSLGEISFPGFSKDQDHGSTGQGFFKPTFAAEDGQQPTKFWSSSLNLPVTPLYSSTNSPPVEISDEYGAPLGEIISETPPTPSPIYYNPSRPTRFPLSDRPSPQHAVDFSSMILLTTPASSNKPQINRPITSYPGVDNNILEEEEDTLGTIIDAKLAEKLRKMNKLIEMNKLREGLFNQDLEEALPEPETGFQSIHQSWRPMAGVEARNKDPFPILAIDQKVKTSARPLDNLPVIVQYHVSMEDDILDSTDASEEQEDSSNDEQEEREEVIGFKGNGITFSFVEDFEAGDPIEEVTEELATGANMTNILDKIITDSQSVASDFDDGIENSDDVTVETYENVTSIIPKWSDLMPFNEGEIYTLFTEIMNDPVLDQLEEFHRDLNGSLAEDDLSQSENTTNRRVEEVENELIMKTIKKYGSFLSRPSTVQDIINFVRQTTYSIGQKQLNQSINQSDKESAEKNDITLTPETIFSGSKNNTDLNSSSNIDYQDEKANRDDINAQTAASNVSIINIRDETVTENYELTTRNINTEFEIDITTISITTQATIEKVDEINNEKDKEIDESIIPSEEEKDESIDVTEEGISEEVTEKQTFPGQLIIEEVTVAARPVKIIDNFGLGVLSNISIIEENLDNKIDEDAQTADKQAIPNETTETIVVPELKDVEAVTIKIKGKGLNGKIVGISEVKNDAEYVYDPATGGLVTILP